MNFSLADLPSPTGNEFLVWLACLTLVLSIAVQIKKLFFPSIPVPMRTKADEPPVTWPTYEKDRDKNADEHRGIEKAHNELSREVSAVNATLEQNGARLLLMDQKVDRLLVRFGLTQTHE